LWTLVCMGLAAALAYKHRQLMRKCAERLGTRDVDSLDDADCPLAQAVDILQASRAPPPLPACSSA